MREFDDQPEDVHPKLDRVRLRLFEMRDAMRKGSR
jgi:hypothetical protein